MGGVLEEWIYIRLDDKMCITFRGSSMVEQQAVNLKVRGPSPRRGARVDYLRNLVSYQRVLARHIGLIYLLL